MPIIPSLAALIIGTAAVGLTGGAWWNYGKVTPATLLYIAQDITQPSLPPTEPAQPAAPVQPATNQATVPTPSPTGSTETTPQPASTGSNQQMSPPERPIMPPPPDQPGAKDFSRPQPNNFPPSPDQQGNGQESDKPRQPMPGRPPLPPPPPGQRGDEQGNQFGQPMPPFQDQQNGRQGQPSDMRQGPRNQPSLPPQRGSNGQGNEMMPAQEQNFEEEQQEPQIDPREIRQALRDITQMQRDLKRFSSSLRRYKADTSEVDQLLEKINQYRATISGSDMEAVGTAVHEFRDENFWETIQKIRAKVELPRQIEQMKKEINRLEKMTKSAIYQRMGVDIDKIITYINDSRAKISQMESLLSSGEFEEINDLIQQNQDSPMPGEIGKVLMRLKEIDSRIRRIRDADLKDRVQSLVSEVVQLVNAGEYREAKDLINQNMQQIQQIFSPPFNRRSNDNRMSPGTQ